MAAWMKKSGWFVINYDIIVPNNEGGGGAMLEQQCTSGDYCSIDRNLHVKSNR